MRDAAAVGEVRFRIRDVYVYVTWIMRGSDALYPLFKLSDEYSTINNALAGPGASAPRRCALARASSGVTDRNKFMISHVLVAPPDFALEPCRLA